LRGGAVAGLEAPPREGAEHAQLEQETDQQGEGLEDGHGCLSSFG
jgi:hypothetical protein